MSLIGVQPVSRRIRHGYNLCKKIRTAVQRSDILAGADAIDNQTMGASMRTVVVVLLLTAVLTSVAFAQGYVGQYTANPYAPNSAMNPYAPNSITNPYGRNGSPYSPKSANNPYATNAPKLYDSQGNYHGRLSSNPYDPDSTSNPYGRYGSRYSPDSINNPYGAGSRYGQDSPNNPYGRGMGVFGQ